MKQENKNEMRYYIWNSDEDLMANVNTEVQLPDGGRLYTCIGKLAIKKGDAISYDHGRSMGVNTMSGKGYESEFKFGRVVLHGGPLALVLNQEQSQHVKFIETSQEEFNAKVSSQKERINSQIGDLKDVFILAEIKRRAEANRIQSEVGKRREEQVKDVLSKMDQFFNAPKPKKM